MKFKLSAGLLIYFLIINTATGDNESVFGDLGYNINFFGVKGFNVQAPEIYTNQIFWLDAIIYADKSYPANTFNATIELPAGFNLPNNDWNHSNPTITGFGSEWITRWTVQGPPTNTNYTINVSTPFFSSKNNVTVKVNHEPPDFTGGTVILSSGGPYNFSDTVIVNATLKDQLGNYTNIIGVCKAEIQYPNSTTFQEDKTLSYITGSYGVYSYNFTTASIKGSYKVSVNCSLPEANNTTTFNVTSNNVPYFSNPFLVSNSYIHRSDNNPTPTQVVDFWSYITDADDDILTVVFSYSSNGLQSFTNNNMIYNSETNTWRTQLSGFSPQTLVYYYILVSDGEATNRTPSSGYDALVWDNPPSEGNPPVIYSIYTNETEPLPEIITTSYYNIIMTVPKYVNTTLGSVEFSGIDVRNAGNGTLTNISLTIDGINKTWYSVDLEGISLEPNETSSFNVKFLIPPDAESKEYPITFEINSNEAKRRIYSTLNIAKQTSEKLLRIKDVEIPKLRTNQIGIIRVIIENPDDKNKRLSLNLALPEGWLTNKTLEALTIPAGGTKVFEYVVIPSSPGSYEITLSGNYEGKIMLEEILLNVLEPEKTWRMYLEDLNIPYHLIPPLILFLTFTTVMILFARKIIRRKHNRKRKNIFRMLRIAEKNIGKIKKSISSKDSKDDKLLKEIDFLLKEK